MNNMNMYYDMNNYMNSYEYQDEEERTRGRSR